MEQDAFYHFYNRGNNRENIFREEENYTYFLTLLKRYLLPVAEFYSYCLLPNHFHFILRIKDEKELPSDIQKGQKRVTQPFSNFFNAYSKAFNKRYDRRGSLFQEHPKRIRIENSDYLRNLILYVNTNPDHHGIGDYRSYPYSSYRALGTSGHTSLKRDEVHELFGGRENFIHCVALAKERIDLSKELMLEEDEET